MSNASETDRLTQLQHRLAVCPTDLLARCDLASLLEGMGQHEDALLNWGAVLAADPNNLKAREGMSRCRTHAGRSRQPES